MEQNFPFNTDSEFDLLLGSSFDSRNGSTAYHTIRYDFKPASVETSRPANVDIGPTGGVTITVPHSQASGGSTFYKGVKRPCPKECVLIIDKKTKTFTLERIQSNLQVKRSRSSAPDVGKTEEKSPTKPEKSEKVKHTSTKSSSHQTTSSKVKKASHKDNSSVTKPQTVTPASPPVQVMSHSISSTSSSSQGEDSSSDESSSGGSDSEEDQEGDVDDKDVEQLNACLSGHGVDLDEAENATEDQNSQRDFGEADTPSKKGEPFFNQLREDLQLSESGSDSD